MESEPAELVKHKEGTFLSLSHFHHTYLSKHVKRCLSKEEREALFKEYPQPDIDTCLVPKVNKYNRGAQLDPVHNLPGDYLPADKGEGTGGY